MEEETWADDGRCCRGPDAPRLMMMAPEENVDAAVAAAAAAAGDHLRRLGTLRNRMGRLK